jgi:hypothetical protein
MNHITNIKNIKEKNSSVYDEEELNKIKTNHT